MWWLVLAIVCVGALIWVGRLLERGALGAQTAKEAEKLGNDIAAARASVDAMSEAELDEAVYGPDDKTPAPHDGWHKANDIKSKVHWD